MKFNIEYASGKKGDVPQLDVEVSEYHIRTLDRLCWGMPMLLDFGTEPATIIIVDDFDALARQYEEE